ncbi:hypothetical protein L6452_21306 [Arctium lappa]|uniref:Uncharacterized protein n=1 Tax=Arctium lappa TaxID=4217 RepID=A0ACB9BEI9_ARCLA|nr:hypothetical protein L6452_21306 [Arctium lappa]
MNWLIELMHIENLEGRTDAGSVVGLVEFTKMYWGCSWVWEVQLDRWTLLIKLLRGPCVLDTLTQTERSMLLITGTDAGAITATYYALETNIKNSYLQ